MESEADVLYFGGSAGSGKSDLLLGAALTRHSRSIIFRREFNELEALEARCEEMIGSREGYNGQKHLWKLNVIGQDRRIEFGAMSRPGAEMSYRGRPHDLKAYDEIPEFTEHQFRFTSAWMRTTDPQQRCRVLVAGNPPMGQEQRWVISYFAPWIDTNYSGIKALPGELRWYARGTDAYGRDIDIEVPRGTPGSKSRTFIPSLVYDNP
ncbi:MAG: terminase, partial [Nitrososphaera sp.]